VVQFQIVDAGRQASLRARLFVTLSTFNLTIDEVVATIIAIAQRVNLLGRNANGPFAPAGSSSNACRTQNGRNPASLKLWDWAVHSLAESAVRFPDV
jgi:hypothetical protein